MFRRYLLRPIAATAVIAILFASAWLLPPDGLAQGGPLRLIGRLHPLLLHFPISLLLLVPALEWLGRRRPALREAAGVLLGLAVCSGLLTVLAGLALMQADGFEGALLVSHRIGGICLVVVTTLAWLLRPWWRAGYLAVLLGTLPLLLWTAHNGGSLSHGTDYLTAALPAPLKRVLRIKEPPPPEIYPPDTVYGAAIHPVLERYCLSCHGTNKQNGNYRMDTFDALLTGGKSGLPAIVPGDLLHSELTRRLRLELDDGKVMPPRRQSRPSAAEIALLQWWVKQGASRTLALAAVKDAPPEVSALLVSSLARSAPSGEPSYTPHVGDYSALVAEIAGLQRSLGIKLVPVSREPRDGLILRTRGAETRFGDAELMRLIPLAPFIVETELGGTRVTDACFATLRQFINLERLHLEGTIISGTALGELQTLTKLNYLNLCGTGVTDRSLAAVTAHPSLRHIYLFNSKVTPAGVAEFKAHSPNCDVGPIETNLNPVP